MASYTCLFSGHINLTNVFTFICELCSQKLPFVNSDNIFCSPQCDKCQLYKVIISSNICYFNEQQFGIYSEELN